MAKLRGLGPSRMVGSVGDYTYRRTKYGTIVTEKIQKGRKMPSLVFLEGGLLDAAAEQPRTGPRTPQGGAALPGAGRDCLPGAGRRWEPPGGREALGAAGGQGRRRLSFFYVAG